MQNEPIEKVKKDLQRNFDSGWTELRADLKHRGIVDYKRTIIVEAEPTDTFIQSIKANRPGHFFFNYKKTLLPDGLIELLFMCSHDSSD